jgi:hypothetical protein
MEQHSASPVGKKGRREEQDFHMGMKQARSKPIDYRPVTCCRRSRNHWCAQPLVASAGASKAELEGCLGPGRSVETSCTLRSSSISGLDCKTRVY